MADELGIRIGAELDESKSQREIRNQLMRMKLDKLKIEIDERAIQQSADNAVKQLNKKFQGSFKSARLEIPFQIDLDKSSSNTIKKEMDSIVANFTKSQGKLVKYSLVKGSVFDEDSGQRVKKVTGAMVQYRDELDRVITKEIAWRRVGTKTGDDGKTKAINGWVVASTKYAQNVEQITKKINAQSEAEKKLAKARTDAERETSGKYWQGRRDEALKALTATSDVSLKMREYYSRLEKDASNAAKTQTAEAEKVAKAQADAAVKAAKAQEKAANDAVKAQERASREAIKEASRVSREQSAVAKQASAEAIKAAKQQAVEAKKATKEAENAAKAQAAATARAAKDAVLSSNQMRKLQKSEIGVRTDSEKGGINLDWSAYNEAYASGNYKQARVEIELLKTELVNLGKIARASMPDNVIENLPVNIENTTTKVIGLENAFKGLKAKGFDVPDGIFSKLSELKTKLQDVAAAPKNEATITQFQRLSDEANTLSTTLTRMQGSMRFDNIVKGVERADVQLKRFQQNMLLLKKDWSAFTKDPELMKQFNDLYSASQAPGAAQNLSVLNAQMGVLKTNIELAGKAQKGFMGRLAQNFSKFVSWFAIGGFTASAVRGFRDIFAAVKDVDAAMTSLRKVTDETDKTYSRFLTNASKKAVQLGASVSDLVSATTSFARLGYSIEDSYSLGQLATVYANVGDEVNGVEGATSSIISTLAGFKLGVQDATSVVDKFNNVGNNFAITSGGLGEALKRSASALHEAGADIDSSIALITGANTVVQDVDMVGTALKTSSLRLRGSTTELEDMGEDVDDFAKSTSLLRGELEALTGVDIMVNDNQYKDIYTVYEEIAKVYDSLTDVSQANVLEILFGKRQANFA